MKKIVNLFITLICMFVLIGCSDKLFVDSKNHVTSKKLVTAIKNIHNTCNIYYEPDSSELRIELVYNSTNAKEIYTQFNDNVSKIINDTKKIILNYPPIEEVRFVPLSNKNALGCSRWEEDIRVKTGNLMGIKSISYRFCLIFRFIFFNSSIKSISF